jgi:cytochrome c-type biogenesis protein CcmH/NrfF
MYAGGFLWVLWFLPALKLVAMILLKVALKHQKF